MPNAKGRMCVTCIPCMNDGPSSKADGAQGGPFQFDSLLALRHLEHLRALLQANPLHIAGKLDVVWRMESREGDRFEGYWQSGLPELLLGIESRSLYGE